MSLQKYVFALFRSFGEGDCHTCFDLISVCDSTQSAHKIIGTLIWTELEAINDIVHKNMRFTNNYTYIGNRTDCKKDCGFGIFGGFVIEKMQIGSVSKKLYTWT